MENIFAILFWFVHLVFGSLIDARLWGDKEKDPDWLAQYFDLIWLGYFCATPFIVQFLTWQGMNLFTWNAVLGGFGMSVFWDLIYCKIEYGKWIHPLPYWFIIPNPFSSGKTWRERRVLVGFTTENAVIVFHLVRVYSLYLSIAL